MKRALIALAESVPVIFKRRRRNRGVAESWMAIDVRREALCHIAAGGIEAIVEAALGNLSKCGRRRWYVIHNRPRMRTAGDGQR